MLIMLCSESGRKNLVKTFYGAYIFIMRLYIGKSSNTLQQVRLIHAISESSYEIVLPEEEMKKYLPLKKFLGMDFLEGNSGDFDLTNWLIIDHAAPMTSIGNLKRPIIFPHSITEYCYSLWQGKRAYRYSFAGLVTEKRKLLLESWIKNNIRKQGYKFPEPNKPTIKTAINKVIGKFKLSHYLKREKIGDMSLWATDRGRTFPIKSWDIEYFKILSNSKFILCPSGDYIWSYRFFESILCGAIPIVEESCLAYQGFRFFTLRDRADGIEWREEDAIYNYGLCNDRITVPIDALDRELDKITGNINSTVNSFRNNILFA